MGYQLTLVRKATTKQSTNNTHWRPCGENKTLLQCWWECKLVKPLWKTVWSTLKKLKIELSYDPAIPLLDIYPEDGNSNLKRYMHPNVHHSTIHNSQHMEAN